MQGNKPANELGTADTHSCYVCYDDWKFERRRCWRRQFEALMIKHLKEAEHEQANN